MKKEEIIRRYGEDAWQKVLAQGRARYNANRDQLLHGGTITVLTEMPVRAKQIKRSI